MKKGFTLIELLIVVAIIAVLAGMLLPVLHKARKRAEDISCLSQEKQVSAALLSYTGDHKDYFPPYCQWADENGTGTAIPFGVNYMNGSWSYKLYQGKYISTHKILFCPSIMKDVTPTSDTAKFWRLQPGGASVYWGSITYAYNNIWIGSSEISNKGLPTVKLNKIKKTSRVMLAFDGGQGGTSSRYGVHAISVPGWGADFGFYNLVSPHGTGSLLSGKYSRGTTNVFYADGHAAGLKNAQRILRNTTHWYKYLSSNPADDRPY